MYLLRYVDPTVLTLEILSFVSTIFARHASFVVLDLLAISRRRLFLLFLVHFTYFTFRFRSSLIYLKMIRLFRVI